MSEPIQAQVDRLASFILAEVDGEPSQSEGAIDTAIRVIRERTPVSTRPSEALNLFMGWLTTRAEDAGPFSGTGENNSQAADLIGEYCRIQGWEEPRENCRPGSWGEKVDDQLSGGSCA